MMQTLLRRHTQKRFPWRENLISIPQNSASLQRISVLCMSISKLCIYWISPRVFIDDLWKGCTLNVLVVITNLCLLLMYLPGRSMYMIHVCCTTWCHKMVEILQNCSSNGSHSSYHLWQCLECFNYMGKICHVQWMFHGSFSYQIVVNK